MNDLPAPTPGTSPLLALALAVGVIVATMLAGQALPESVTNRYPWADQAVAQGLMLAFALGAMAWSKRPFAEFGFRRPEPAKGYFKLWGLALGVASTGAMLVLGLAGMRGLVAGYGLVGIVLWIWIVCSFGGVVFFCRWFECVVGW